MTMNQALYPRDDLDYQEKEGKENSPVLTIELMN